MSVLVLGASSQIGYYYLRRRLEQGGAVTAVSRVRQADSADGRLRWLQGDIAALPALGQFQAIVSFGPLVGLVEWLSGQSQAPAPHLVATSSMSVVTKRDSVVAAERELVGSLADGEVALQAQCQRLGMRCTVLRPTIVYGAGRDRSLTPLARRALRWRVFPLPGGSGWRQPVHADDIALAVERSLACTLPDGLVLEIGGGERLRASEMFARVHRALPVSTLALPVPQLPLRAAAAVLPAIRGPVSRLAADLVADNADLIHHLGFSPRPFQLDAAMLGTGENWQQTLAARPLRHLESIV